jgi:hypothetical protein
MHCCWLLPAAPLLHHDTRRPPTPHPAGRPAVDPARTPLDTRPGSRVYAGVRQLNCYTPPEHPGARCPCRQRL